MGLRSMSSRAELHIDLKHMTVGQHVFEYELADDFFESLAEAEIKHGRVSAHVIIDAHDDYFNISYSTNGTVIIPCDRCLDDMEQHVEGNDDIVVRFGNEQDTSDDLVIIDERIGMIDLSWLIYEQIALAIPIQHTHNDGQCNPGMTAYIINDETQNTEDQTTDPRWDKLKTILNNNKLK